MRFIVLTIVLAATAEVAYISLQSALGQASHYNVADTFHKTMYQLMGLATLAVVAFTVLTGATTRSLLPGAPGWVLMLIGAAME